MKYLLIIFLFVSSLFASAQDFTTEDAAEIQQLIMSKSYGKGLNPKQMKQIELLNTTVVAKGKIPVAKIEPEVLIEYANSMLYEYGNYKDSEKTALKLVFILKRLYKTDPNILEKLDSQFRLSPETQTKLKNEIIK